MQKTKATLFVVLVIVIVAALAIAAFLIGRATADTSKTRSNQTNTSQNSSANGVATKDNDGGDDIAMCKADDLSLSTASNGGSGAGTLSFDLVFKNTSGETCTMAGFPGVSLINTNGTGVGDPATENKSVNAANVITLTANQTAKAAVLYGDEGNYPTGQCTDGGVKLRVYPPGSTAYIDVATPGGSMARCPKFEVAAVQ